jgi:hypothetical protein
VIRDQTLQGPRGCRLVGKLAGDVGLAGRPPESVEQRRAERVQCDIRRREVIADDVPEREAAPRERWIAQKNARFDGLLRQGYGWHARLLW